jgi:thymidylate synthase
MNSHLAENLNELTFDLCKSLLDRGNKVESRNGSSYELCDQDIRMSDPRQRHLYLKGRTNNIYATLGEIFWVLSGNSNLDPLMNFFLPRAINYSDDGVAWTNAYGPKLYRSGNLQNVIQSFIQDGPNTRRAVCAIWTPETDTIYSLNKIGIEKPKDISCNNFIYFWIRDNKLNMKVTVRSNDVLFGLSAINIPEWTFLQEVILNTLKNVDPRFKNIELGYFSNTIISLHLYEETSKQAISICSEENKNENTKRINGKLNKPLILGPNVTAAQSIQFLFGELYNGFCALITDSPYKPWFKTFEDWDIPIANNQLADYCFLLTSFIDYKKTGNVLPLELNLLSPDLAEAVRHNHFTPKNENGKSLWI